MLNGWCMCILLFLVSHLVIYSILLKIVGSSTCPVIVCRTQLSCKMPAPLMLTYPKYPKIRFQLQSFRIWLRVHDIWFVYTFYYDSIILYLKYVSVLGNSDKFCTYCIGLSLRRQEAIALIIQLWSQRLPGRKFHVIKVYGVWV